MISVSIVTYHTPVAELRTCLECLNSVHISRIYIIDNGQDKEIQQIAAQYPKTTYIPRPNHGYGTGHNTALRRVLATPDCEPYHLVMNSDLIFDPKILGEMERYMDQNPDIATLQPKLVSPDGNLQHSCRLLPTPLDLITRRFLPPSFLRKKRAHYLLTHLNPDQEHNIPNHQGSFMFLRTDALRRVGLFDERFFMYSEDIDLTRRLHAHYRTIYWPRAEVIHTYRSASYHSLRMLRIHIVSIVKYFNKWGWFRDPERTRLNRPLRKGK